MASSEFHSFETVETFLLGRIRALENVENTSSKSGQSRHGGKSQATSQQGARSVKTHVGTSSDSQAPPLKLSHQPQIASQFPCVYCQQSHFIVACPQFKELPPSQRRTLVLAKNLCFNCLGKHAAKNCQSKIRCKKCNQLHHTMIHQEPSTTASDAISVNSSTH